MIDSTLLLDHHQDPFDRVLIAQAKYRNLRLVSKDRHVPAMMSRPSGCRKRYLNMAIENGI